MPRPSHFCRNWHTWSMRLVRSVSKTTTSFTTRRKSWRPWNASTSYNHSAHWLMSLNHFVKRERFQSTPPALAVADIAESRAKYLMVFIAFKGYQQYPLNKDRQLLTTFIMPFGHYKFMHTPFGLYEKSTHSRMCSVFFFRATSIGAHQSSVLSAWR